MTMEEFMQYGAPAGGGGTATAAPPKKMSAADFENYGAPTAEDYTAIYQGIKSNQPFGESPPDAYQRNIKLAADMDQGNRGAITGSAPYRVAEDIVSASASAIVNPLLSAENALGIDAAGDMLSQRQTQYDISHNRDMGYVQKTAGGIGESIAEYATLAAAGGGFGSALGLGKWGAKALKWATVGGGTGNKSYEDTYRSSINSGKTEDEAQKIALATAAVEVGVMAAFQKAGLGGAEGAIVDGLGIGAAKGSAKKLSLQGAKKFFTQTAGELAEEEITTFAQTMAQEGNPGSPKAYLDTAVQTLGTMGLLSGSQKLINFTTNPSRKNAKEAGLDEIATNQKQRADLARKFGKGLTAAKFEEQLRAAVSPEQAERDLAIWRARAEAAGESFDEYVSNRVKGIEKTTSDNSVYMAQRQSGKPDALAQDIDEEATYRPAFNYDENGNPLSLRQLLDVLDRKNPRAYESATESGLDAFSRGLATPENADVASLEGDQLNRLAENLYDGNLEQLSDIIGEFTSAADGQSVKALAKELQLQEGIPDGELNNYIKEFGTENAYQRFVEEYGMPVPLMRALRAAAPKVGKGDRSFADFYDTILGGPGQNFRDQGGKPDALAQDQPTPVDTPEFKAWFGESKVADAEGKPLRVYHGTSDDFDSFNLDHKNRKDTGWLGTGVYLTTSQDIASSYANLKPGYAGKNVMALYAKVENPYYATIKDKQRLQLISNRSLAEGREAADAWTAELKAKGHDGVILRFNESEVGKANASEEIVVFSPSAVKSATGNSGKFDPNDPSILAQKNAPKPRGEIQFHQDDGLATIRLFENQNESTFIHESAHLFRRDLKGSDLKEAERWAGVVDGDWGRKNEKGIAEAEEKFARGFERYLYEGVAPNKQLESIFARFKAALSKIYSVLAKSPINIDISPEMRTVFDRLLTPSGNQDGNQVGNQNTQNPAISEASASPAGNLSATEPATAEEPLELGTFPPPNPDMLSQAPVSPDLAAKNASMDEARAAMGLPAINQPAAPGANMPHHIAEQEAIRQRIPERASGIVMDYLSDKRKEPLNQLETAGLAVYGDRLNEAYARLQEDVNNLTLDEGERMTKAAEMERIEQDFDLLSRAMRQSGTAQSLAFSQRKHVVGSDYRPLSVESRAAAAKGKKLTAREKQKLNKTAKEIKAADEKLEAQKQKEAAKVETTREKIKKTVKKLKEYVAKAKLPTDLNRYAQDLAKQYLAEGVTGRRELIDKVQKAVREIFPETQRRQVIDAISGYGDFKELSKDEASVRLRDLKGQLQQISKLKDMSEGKAPSKTGMERRDPSDTERALIKEVNEAKKEGGYEVTDPAKQLASALSTIKTRLRNQIKDLQAQIDSRQKLIKQKKAAPSDEETKRLTEERDALKTQFDDIFGKEGLTDAQRIANAERATKKSIEDLQRRLDAGDFSPRPQYAGNPVPESLAKLREKAAELRAQYNSSKPVSLDEKKRLEQSIARTEKSISELERRINQGDYSEAPKRPPASSDQLKALKDRAAELRAQYNSGKPVSLDEKKRLEKATLAAEKAVTELERRLKEGDFSTKPKRPPATNQNIQVLKDRADALRKKYAATNPNPPALEAAKERLAVLQAHLKNGTVPDVRPRQQSKNPVMKAIQQRLADARKELAQSEPSQRARLRKSIGELEAKLEAGQFALPDGAPRPASPEIERLQYERDKLRRKIRAEINELRPKTVWDRIASPLNLSRSFATTFDLPPMFRQGSFITLGNPVRSTRAAVAGLRGMFSDFNARKQLADIEARPNAPLYARAKLYLADMDGSPSAREEAFVGRLADKIPLVRSVIHASERNYTVFLNRLRADTFDAMAASLSRNGEPTMEEAQAIARFINIATGRGDFGRFEQTMSGLAPVFFSPRYVGSRLQLLALQPLSGGSAATKKLIAKEYGKALLGAALVATLAMAAGADLEDDPTDPDFLKLKFGSTRLDFLAGLSQTAVITTRMGYGTAKTIDALARGKTRATKYAQSEAAVAGKFLRSKLSPMASLSLNLATGEDYVGDKVTKTKIAQDLFQPLSFRDIYDAMEEQGAPKGLSMWILSLFGVGMQTYDN